MKYRVKFLTTSGRVYYRYFEPEEVEEIRTELSTAGLEVEDDKSMLTEVVARMLTDGPGGVEVEYDGGRYTPSDFDVYNKVILNLSAVEALYVEEADA